jgi:hypothetical protein
MPTLAAAPATQGDMPNGNWTTHTRPSWLWKHVVQHRTLMQQGCLNQDAMPHLNSKIELCTVGWLVQAWQHLPSIGLLQQVTCKLC